MTAYVEQLHRSEKRVKLIEGRLQIVRLLLSNDQAPRGRLTRFVDPASSVLLPRMFHHKLLSPSYSCAQGFGVSSLLITCLRISSNSAGRIPDTQPERGRTLR